MTAAETVAATAKTEKLGQARVMTMHDIAFEADGLINLLAMVAMTGRQSGDIEPTAGQQLTSLVRRLLELNSLMLTGLGDDMVSDEALSNAVRGVLPAEAAEVQHA